MQSEKLYIGIDAGTQSVKVAVFDEHTNCLCSYTKPTTLTYPNPGWVDMDIDEFLNITIDCIKLCVDDVKGQGYSANAIKSVLCDGVICGICGVDKEGNAITPYINYLDSRTQDDVNYINNLNLEIFAKETGNPEAKCLFPAMFARWFIKNSQAFNERGVKFVHNAPYIGMHLAGLKGDDAYIDWGTMSGWGLGYKVEKKEWSDEQLQILCIDKKYMPRILKPWDVVGNVCSEMAERTGLSTDTKICAGAGDTMQSMLGAGIFKANQGVDVAGTCAMFCVSTKGIIPKLSQKGTGLIFNSGTLPDTYFYWGFIRTGGLALRWFKDSVCQKGDDPAYYQNLSKEAAKIGIGSNGVIFLPYLTGGTDFAKNACGAFLNLELDTDQFVMWRAVLEAIGFDYMEIADVYKDAGVDLTRITVAEGGSRDHLWNQIKADMLDAVVTRYKVSGGAVRTNSVFAAYAAGDVDDLLSKLESLLEKDAEYEPNKENSAQYRKLFTLKRELVQSDMPSSFTKLAKIREECSKFDNNKTSD